MLTPVRCRLFVLAMLVPTLALTACEESGSDEAGDDWSAPDGVQVTSCDPQMSVFPVGDAHNIGYDNASCGTGTCEIGCPDANANSDWGGDHHGIDIFAYQRAPLVAVAAGEIVAVGTPSSTSGLRVRLRDACGWEYYYGHMDEAVVGEGQWVSPGDLLGYMGYTGTSSTHTHFNVSPDGQYSSDIDPIWLLAATSATACDGSTETGSESGTESGSESGTESGSESGAESGSESGSDAGSGATVGECGAAAGNTVLTANQTVVSCDGRFTLYMQDDGNLVLYENGGGALWSTSTQGNAGAWAIMQTDGNLVVYSAGGSALWWTSTHGNEGAVLAVQDDGNLVVYSAWGTALWNSGTCCH